MQVVISETEQKQLTLNSYVLYSHTNHCSHCGWTERYSQLYELWLHPTKKLQNLRPASGPLKSIPMHNVTADLKKVPVCIVCGPVMASPDVGEAAAPLSREAWQETLARKYAPVKQEVKVAAKTTTTKIIPTLDQI